MRWSSIVIHDVLGFGGADHLPKFVRPYANLADDAVDALKRFFGDVQSGAFPSDEETYHMSEASFAALQGLMASDAADGR